MCEVTDCFFFFFFNDTATTEIYTLSLHDALPIYSHDLFTEVCYKGSPRRIHHVRGKRYPALASSRASRHPPERTLDRKSTRLNSSHANISYAVFCLKKKKHNS